MEQLHTARRWPSGSLDQVSQRRWAKRLKEYSGTFHGQVEHMVRHFHLTHSRRPNIDTLGWARRHICLPFPFQGKITFPNGFTLDGSFSSGTDKGLYTQGVLDTAALPPDLARTRKR